MKLSFRVASHLAVFAIGGAIAFITSRPGLAPEPQASGVSLEPKAASAGAPSHRKDGRGPFARPVSRKEFRAAWAAFSRGRERRAERLPKQKKLLAAWAEIDLEGALDAAMAESWDNDGSGRQDHELLNAFDKVFAARPLDAWALIQSGKWEKVPPDDRHDAAASLLTQLEWRAGSLTTDLDLAIEAGQWQILAQTGPALLRNEAFLSDSGALAAWAAKLPDHPESPALFREAVDHFVGQDLPRARTWIAGLPAGGWQQEQALAAFFRQALRQQADTGAADWALDQISDPALREEAATWRRDWEKSHAKPAATLK